MCVTALLLWLFLAFPWLQAALFFGVTTIQAESHSLPHCDCPLDAVERIFTLAFVE
jgi:hypothetical protein